MGATQHRKVYAMNIYPFITRAVLLPSLFLVTSLSALRVHASASGLDLLQGAKVSAPASALNVMASGAVEETLKVCLARIPRDASAGQRLLAGQSCERAERTRKQIQSARKF